MNYSLGYAFNLEEIMELFPLEKLKLTCDECEKIIGDRHRRKLVNRIFKDSVKVILNDIIDNNSTFKLPLRGGRTAEIHMRKISGDTFMKLRKAGKWKNIDFLKSNFTGYMLCLYMFRNGLRKRKNIYVNKELRDKIDQNTNNKMQYC